MTAAFRRRRDLLVQAFRSEAPGVEFVEPLGAFYLLFRVDGLKKGYTGTEFCARMLGEHGVAMVPGGAFADDRWVRLSYATSDRDLTVAAERIITCFKQVESGS
jgi:aspartate aminotransferase